ncbi:hypothetical protein [Burkholderia cepacia]|uniref:hypothetical protein n=1 Tax=Burkholderia cepacia TaxID=292 RepID=UPI00398EF2A6
MPSATAFLCIVELSEFADDLTPIEADVLSDCVDSAPADLAAGVSLRRNAKVPATTAPPMAITTTRFLAFIFYRSHIVIAYSWNTIVPDGDPARELLEKRKEFVSNAASPCGASSEKGFHIGFRLACNDPDTPT